MERKRDSERSKQRILDAAETEFAEKGFYGARVDEIALKADINKRMIYAYYTDKENLYKQVLIRVYKRMECVEEELVSQNLSGTGLIRRIIEAYFDFLRNNQSFVNILMWENLNQAKYLREVESSYIERNTLDYFRKKLDEGIAQGMFSKKVDAGQTVISLITMCFANFSNQYTLSKMFGVDLTGEALMEQRKQHTIQVMLAYLNDKNGNEVSADENG